MLNYLKYFAAVGLWGFLGWACSSDFGEVQETAIDKNINRSCIKVREIGWAGSVSNAGVYDPDDDFLELYNDDCGVAIDLTGFQIILEGDVEDIYVVPDGNNNTIEPQEYKVIAAKASGAFGENAHILLPGMYFPSRNFTIETRTGEDFLMENSMNIREGLPLAGGYDGFVTRSMERSEDKFDEEGGAFTSWHSFTPCNETLESTATVLGTGCDSGDEIGENSSRITSGYENYTFATPGESNTDAYY